MTKVTLTKASVDHVGQGNVDHKPTCSPTTGLHRVHALHFGLQKRDGVGCQQLRKRRRHLTCTGCAIEQLIEQRLEGKPLTLVDERDLARMVSRLKMCNCVWHTDGLVPAGHSRFSSLMAVYSPPKPPPRMHTRGGLPGGAAPVGWSAMLCSIMCMHVATRTACGLCVCACERAGEDDWWASTWWASTQRCTACMVRGLLVDASSKYVDCVVYLGML